MAPDRLNWETPIPRSKATSVAKKKPARGKAAQKTGPHGKSRPAAPTLRSVAAQRRPSQSLPAAPSDAEAVQPAQPLKPAKNQAGFKTAELERYRELLLAKRRELVGDMSQMEREALQRGGNSNLSNLPLHMADMGTDNYEQEFTLGLMEKDRKLLKEINLALAKIQDGRYGICEGTGQPISKVRLEAQPWARFSIDYARKMEHGGVGAGRVSRDFNRATDT